MTPLTALWLPILLSALAVFVASMVAWAVLPYHRSDYRPLPNEDQARGVLRGLAPGQYNLPNVPSIAALAEPEVVEKFTAGPVGFLTVAPNRVPRVAPSMVQWLAFLVLIAVVVAYLAGRSVAPGAGFADVFRATAIVSWLAFGAGIVQDAVWYARPWRAVWKQLFDAALMGAASGAVFGWLWPE